MSFLDKCKSLLLDPHPEQDESHAATRYALDRAHCPAQPCPGANPALCGVCADMRKPLSVAKPLYERELPLVDTPAQDTLEQRFAAFDKENPVVYVAIRNCIFHRVREGASYVSMKGIFETLRGTMGGGGVKLNNSYTSLYTDKFIADYPHFEKYFRRRARAVKRMALHYVR